MKRINNKTITGRELAAELACNRQSINRWAGDGMPTAVRGRGGRPSRYDVVKCKAWLAERREAAAVGAPVDLMRERARRERAQAILAEQLHQTRSRTLLPADEVERVWTAEVTAVRAHLLAWQTTLVDRVHRAAITEGLPGVERELHVAVYEVLRELAGGAHATAIRSAR